MSCAFEEDLTASLDGELPPARAKELDAHLATCADCQKTHALLKHALEALSALPAFEPSSGLRRNVLTAIDQLPKPLGERLGRWLRPQFALPAGGVLAALVVAVVVASTQRHHNRSAPLTPSSELELAMNYEIVDNYEVLGVDSAEDLDVVEHLQELEKTP
jgi:anti-sigma factor RsiW